MFYVSAALNVGSQPMIGHEFNRYGIQPLTYLSVCCVHCAGQQHGSTHAVCQLDFVTHVFNRYGVETTDCSDRHLISVDGTVLESDVISTIFSVSLCVRSPWYNRPG